MVSDSRCCAGWSGAIDRRDARCYRDLGEARTASATLWPLAGSRPAAKGGRRRSAGASSGRSHAPRPPHHARGQHAWQKAAWIGPNVISRDGSWCSFSLSEGLISKLPMRGPFPMQTYGSLWHAIVRADGSAGSARREPSTGTVRARAARGILVLALGLGSLGLGSLAAAAPASAGTDSASGVRASAGQPADSLTLSAGAGSMSSCNIGSMPWMYGSQLMPWMYAPRISSGGMVAALPAPIPAERGVGISKRHNLQRLDRCLSRWLKGARCRAALLAATRRAVVTAPVGRHRPRCAIRP